MFTSIYFLLFLVATILAYFCFRLSWRPVILLAASWVFCLFLDKKAFVLLLGITVLTYGMGLLLEKLQQKKLESWSRILLAIVVMGYLCLFWEHVSIGVSFYLFQAIGYLVDITRGKSSAEKNFVYLSLYFAFFAKFISGPIERTSDFVPQLKNLHQVKFLNRGRLSTALTYLLWGGFMKMVVADRLAVPVGIIFESPANFDSLQLILGAIGYTFQIYCDFAGYSYLVIGIALLFGIKLVYNFEMPYMAENISIFWRKWHISLSSWLRDYVYIPLGGNRKGIMRKCINTIIVFAICGIWHGRSFHYLLWGLLHGFYLVMDTLWKDRIKKKLPRMAGRAITFLAVAFAWIFFRVSGLKTGILYVMTMFTAGLDKNCWMGITKMLSTSVFEVVIILLGILTVCLVDVLCEKEGEHLPDLIQHKQNHVRYFIFYLLFISIFLFGVYGPGYHASDFIYMQF